MSQVHSPKPVRGKIPLDFPGSPVVKTCPSMAGGMGSIPSQGSSMCHVVWLPQNFKIK